MINLFLWTYRRHTKIRLVYFLIILFIFYSVNLQLVVLYKNVSVCLHKNIASLGCVNYIALNKCYIEISSKTDILTLFFMEIVASLTTIKNI